MRTIKILISILSIQFFANVGLAQDCSNQELAIASTFSRIASSERAVLAYLTYIKRWTQVATTATDPNVKKRYYDLVIRYKKYLASHQARLKTLPITYVNQHVAKNNCEGKELKQPQSFVVLPWLMTKGEVADTFTHRLSWAADFNGAHDGFIVEVKGSCHPITDVCSYTEIARVSKNARSFFVKFSDFVRQTPQYRVKAFQNTDIVGIDLESEPTETKMPSRNFGLRVVDLQIRDYYRPTSFAGNQR